MKKLLIILPLLSLSLLANSIDMIETSTELLENAYNQGSSKKFKDTYISKSMQDKVRKLTSDVELLKKNQELKKLVFKEKENITYENGEIKFKKRTHDKVKYDIKQLTSTAGATQKSQNFSNQIYLFMSASVPKQTWVNYAQALSDNKLRNATMLLRGCIGGNCQKFKPTLKFFRDIVETNKEKPIEANMHIDPMVFRKYKITQAPCVVFAENISFQDKSLSQGLDNNIVDPGTIYKSCGDWSLSYHMRIISKASKNKEALDLYNKLVKNGY